MTVKVTIHANGRRFDVDLGNVSPVDAHDLEEITGFTVAGIVAELTAGGLAVIGPRSTAALMWLCARQSNRDDGTTFERCLEVMTAHSAAGGQCTVTADARDAALN